MTEAAVRCSPSQETASKTSMLLEKLKMHLLPLPTEDVGWEWDAHRLVRSVVHTT